MSYTHTLYMYSIVVNLYIDENFMHRKGGMTGLQRQLQEEHQTLTALLKVSIESMDTCKELYKSNYI